ncbi:MAG TPA: sodium ABC transporter permease [Alteromonas sp.]|jgi:sodium transport system permease protein|nr:sodium ABC transporter permease [Alteromonas sp.]HCB08711.1 sodium ABC transporter permease [Alteromonas sp.]HCL10838.1 sodium ABC transporter permease [Alteromonas sp.]HCV19808.1 sodium ABC transporter permease [Alteromonas sp.]|tara:strand:+ start:14734 stop:15927 length:1194 start_codon:yes stop_codon:yes gene_type:complete
MWKVMLKEIKELLRDRKTLFFMVALPILVFPLLIGVVMFFAGKAVDKAENKVLDYAVVGAQYAPALVEDLAASDLFNQVMIDEGEDIAAFVKSEQADFVLVIPDNFSEDALQSGQIELSLYLNDAGLNMVRRRLDKIVDVYAERSQQKAFASLELDESQQQALIEPIVIKKVDVADKRENWGEKIGGMIPYFIFMLCLQGAMIPATDLGAGEKERGTLETLLISPIERHKLVLGKFLTIALAGATSALITVSSMAVWGLVISQGMAIKMVSEFMSAINAIDFVLMFLMLVPVVAIFSAVLLSLSIYARSFKEAQGYMTPLVFAVIVPVMLAMLPGVELKGGWAWVPLTNVALAIKELIKGTMDYFQLFAIFSSTAVIAGALLYFCVYWFNKEKVLFR